MCIGMKVDLWKLMWRPVAQEKLSRMFFRFVTPSMSPLIRMSVSSAYWSTGQGRRVNEVADHAFRGGLLQKPLLDVSDYYEEIWGDGVALLEPQSALEPATWNAVQEDGSFACAKGAGNPISPQVTEPLSTHDAVEAVPRHRVERLLEIELEDSSRLTSLVAAAQEVGRIYEIFGNVSAINKAGLVRVDQSWDERPKPISKNLGHEFHWTILEGDGHEGVGRVCAVFLGEEDQVSTVEAI